MTTTTLAELPKLKGESLGTSEWYSVTQERVNTFATATDDHQWIHVDVERAVNESPFGATIAHGYLILSLIVPMYKQVFTVRDSRMGLNYGLNKVRFPSPLPVGSMIRLRATLKGVERIDGGLQITVAGTVEREGSEKPVCVAELVFRLYP
jgi:acyl dehydratase